MNKISRRSQIAVIEDATLEIEKLREKERRFVTFGTKATESATVAERANAKRRRTRGGINGEGEVQIVGSGAARSTEREDRSAGRNDGQHAPQQQILSSPSLYH